MKRNEVWIVDLDGVVNSNNKRDHLIPENVNSGRAWAEWHKAHTLEQVNPDMVRRLNEAHNEGVIIKFCSMRPSGCSKSTANQLYNAGIKWRHKFVFSEIYNDEASPIVKENAVYKLLNAIEFLGIFKTTVTFIDDSEANIRAVQESDRISDLLYRSGIQLIVELYTVFKA